MKFCPLFQSQQWIQTGVTVHKCSTWVKFGNFLSSVTLKFDWWPSKTIGQLFWVASSFVHHFVAIGQFKLELLYRNNTQLSWKSAIFCPVWTWESDGWPWKTIGHLFYTTSSFVHHFTTISELKLELHSGNAQFGAKSAIFGPVTIGNSNSSYCPEMSNLGQNRRFFVPCDLEIWRRALKDNRAPLLCYFKLCASFYNHRLHQTRVTVQKRLHGVLTSVTWTFDLWFWPFAWTSLLSMVISSENFIVIRWE